MTTFSSKFQKNSLRLHLHGIQSFLCNATRSYQHLVTRKRNQNTPGKIKIYHCTIWGKFSFLLTFIKRCKSSRILSRSFFLVKCLSDEQCYGFASFVMPKASLKLSKNFYRRNQVSNKGETRDWNSRRVQIIYITWHFWILKPPAHEMELIVFTTSTPQKPQFFHLDFGSWNEVLVNEIKSLHN